LGTTGLHYGRWLASAMSRRFIVSLLLGSLLLLGISNAHAFLFGVIGDSMSTAANTEDVCNDAVECLDNMGTDNKYSFAHGREAWSLLNRLKTIEPGLTGAKSVAENGSRWDDAPDQALRLMLTPNIRIVHIEMGANDVCSYTLPTLQELAEIEFYIDETFTTLADELVNGAVIVSEVPDVVRVRDIYRTQSHFLFDTFQDLWDFETNNLRSSAIDDICEDFLKLGSFLCGKFGLNNVVELVLEEGLEEIIDQTDAKFPCQRVLGGNSTDLDRQQARELNQQINALLAVKVQEYDGRNNNAFFIADNVDEGQFTRVEISKLDGFHLGKAGQEWLANLIWSRVGPNFFLPSPPTTTTTTATTTTSAPVTTTTVTVTTTTLTSVTATQAVTTTTSALVTTTQTGATTTIAVTTTTGAVTTTTNAPLGDSDTDGDAMTDLEEGTGDEDSDGIADFLDDFNLGRGQLQVDVHNPNAGTLRASVGRLALGDISFNANANGARVTRQEIVQFIANAVDRAVEQSCVPDCFDFDVKGLFPGITVKVVLPLSGPIPQRAVYRKLINGVWLDFVVNATDAVGSAPKSGDCPSPGDNAYTTDGDTPNGLIPGHRCIQLWITDGGPNDGDQVVNGMVRDPGGTAVLAASNDAGPAADEGSSGGGGCSVNNAPLRPLQRGDEWLLILLFAGLWYLRVSPRSQT